MPFEIKMPMLSPTMESGKLVRWLKKEGEKINYEDVVAEIETDKAIMEVVSYSEGVLYKILVPDNTESVPVNKVICVLLLDGESEEDINNNGTDNKISNTIPVQEIKENIDTTTLQKPEVKKNIDAITSQTHTPSIYKATILEHTDNNLDNYPKNKKDDIDGGKVFITPVAKKIAKENNINTTDLSKITGSGPRNRIVKSDIENMLNTKLNTNIGTKNILSSSIAQNTIALDPTITTYKEVEISPMRKTIAERLVISKSSIPHFYLKNTCCVDKLLQLRADMNSIFTPENDASNICNTKITINDFFIKASAMALKDSPQMNASWNKDNIIQYSVVDIAVAVALEDGLITPIVRSADTKSLSQISANVKDLAIRAKSGKLNPNEYQGGGFTISNLGMYGTEECFSIINPPQVAILAVGALRKELEFTTLINGNREIIEKNVITVTVSCDHRVADGAIAATFFQKFKNYIENPILMLV